MKKKVLVAMSGGVDSSVAAVLLLEQGYEVIGVTMQLWDYSKNKPSCDPNSKFDTCCSLDDVADARMVAHKLGIPFYVFDYQDDFKENVVDYFTAEYLKGRTPNPCVACNTFLKFDHLLDRAKRLGCDFIATGHYAQIHHCPKNNEYMLAKGVDPNKDQSYFLYSMDQERLSRTLFPVGGLEKTQVRAIAQKYELDNATKKESMEICFIPNNDYGKFISEQIDKSRIIKGNIFHENGQLLGQHEGIHHFTVGQRKGVGISAQNPLYVTRIEHNTGNIYVGEEAFLYRKGFFFKKFHMTSDRQSIDAESIEVKIRYRSKAILAKISVGDGDHAELTFDEPQRAVTPGQIAVLYKGNFVLGGGFIDRISI